MDKEQKKNMLKYIAALEGVNEQLVIALKHCLRMLCELQPPGEDEANWKKMLNDLEDITGLSDNIFQNKQELFN